MFPKISDVGLGAFYWIVDWLACVRKTTLIRPDKLFFGLHLTLYQANGDFPLPVFQVEMSAQFVLSIMGSKAVAGFDDPTIILNSLVISKGVCQASLVMVIDDEMFVTFSGLLFD